MPRSRCDANLQNEMERGKLRVCFVPDEIVGDQIRSYRVKECTLKEHNDEDTLPMKRSRGKDSVSTPRGTATRIEKKEKLKENKTPSKSPKSPRTPRKIPKKPDITAGDGNERHLRERKRPTDIQRVIATENSEDDSQSSDANDDENQVDYHGDSTDNEVTFKVHEKTKKRTGVQGSTKKEELKTPAKELSRLREMAEEYFAVHHQKKIVTSDRNLSKLQNQRMTQNDLIEHLSDASGSHHRECSRLFKQHVALFPKWIFQLRHGFNVLLHGLGSKRRLLDEFRKQMLPDLVHIVVNGFFPSLNIKSILNMITEDIIKYNGTYKSLTDQCDVIKAEFNTEDAKELFLIIHNIDGPMLRNTKAQNALSYLASSSKIHIIASTDHINAPIIWDQNRSSRFNWLWYDVTTYDRYIEETSFENSLLVQQTGSLALSSLTHVLRSLTPNARGIFKLLVQYQLDHDGDGYYTGMPFGDLYQKCRENFLANSDLTLRAQLTEFKDHKLIKSKKGADGVETLSIPLNSSNLKQFMEDNEL
ncbi:origin recognition complex subunit 2-like [Rhopilema esculentum]|uniref:origin recognition complex subunit 2-like n=1 Tax=Rhopilema esculentum TaxID=499914 RepID=UPI0031E0B892